MSSLAHPILSALFPRISPSAGWAVRCRRAAISCYPRYYQQSMQKRYAMMLSGSNRSSAASKAESHRRTTNMVSWRREPSVMKDGAGHFHIRRAALEAFERASRAAQTDTVATHCTGARMASRRPERELHELESMRRLAIATMFMMGINTRDDNGNIPMPHDVGSSVGAEPGRVLGQLPRQVKRRPDSTDELNEAMDSPSRPRDTDLLMQVLSVASHGKQESHIPANLGAASCLNANITAPGPGSAQEHVPTSPSVPLRIVTPPDRLHPTLSSWIKNMNKLSNLIDRLQELASSAPVQHRSQLSRQVVMLRETFKSQQERCVEFLQLSEEYASKYLLDISGEIQQQGSFLEALEKRLDMAKMLRVQAVALRKSHESRTVATMKYVRITALSRPLPQDFDLFSEVDFVLAEICRCYEELDKFWTEEICRAVKALEMRRVDLRDFERWKNFHANLKQAIEIWKARPSSCQSDAGILRREKAYSSTGANIGSIVFSLLPAIGSLKEVLKRVRSSASLEHTSHLGTSLVLRLELAYAENRDLCLCFLQRCIQFAEIMTCPPHITGPISSHVGSLQGLQEWAMRSRFDATGVSAESAAGAQGSQEFNTTYKKALSLQQKTISELDTLLENFSSRVTVTEGLPDAEPLGVVTLQQLHKLSYTWAEARDSVRAALVTLTSEPANRLYYRSAPLYLTRRRSGIGRWITSLVCVS